METPMPDQTPAAEILDRLVPHLRKIAEQLEQINTRLDKGLVRPHVAYEQAVGEVTIGLDTTRFDAEIERARIWQAGTVGDLAAGAAIADLLRREVERQGMPKRYLLPQDGLRPGDRLETRSEAPGYPDHQVIVRDFENGPEL
jgi:hypothetical protein